MYPSKSLLLAVAILMQPLCTRAEDKGWTFYQAVGVGAVVGGTAWLVKQVLFTPESNESLIIRAQGLQNSHKSFVQDWQSNNYSATEKDFQAVAQKYATGSYDATKGNIAWERDKMRAAHNTLLDRMTQIGNAHGKDNADYRAMEQCESELRTSILVYNRAYDYVERQEAYFRLHDTTRQATSALRQECFEFHGPNRFASCAEDLKKILREHRAAMNHVSRHSELYEQAQNVDSKLVMLLNRVAAADVSAKTEQEKENLARTRQARMQEEERLRVLQEENERQARLQRLQQQRQQQEQEQKNIAATAKATQQAYAREQEKRDLEQAKAESRKTYVAEQEKRNLEKALEESKKTHAAEEKARKEKKHAAQYAHDDCERYVCRAQDGTGGEGGKECPVFNGNKHNECTGNKCLLSRPLSVCLKHRPLKNVDAKLHERCKYFICYANKEHECPARRVHEYCNMHYCTHHRDEKCPKFYERKN